MVLRLALVTILFCTGAHAGSVIPVYWGGLDHGEAWLPFWGNETGIMGTIVSPPITRYNFSYFVSTGGLGCLGGDLFCGAQNFQWVNANPYSAYVMYDAYWAVFGGVHVTMLIRGELQSTWSGAPEAPPDTQPPSTTATVNATAAPNPGWFENDGSVGLSAVDLQSGVPAGGTLYYQPGGLSWSTYTAPIGFTGEGTHTLTFFSYDAAANAESTQVLTFDVDYSPPQLSGFTPKHEYREYFNVGTQGWEFQVPAFVTDTLASGAQFSFYLDEATLDNVSGCAAGTPDSATGFFTMTCGVIDPSLRATATFGWTDQAGHLTTADVSTTVPEPASWLLTLPVGFALLWRSRRRRGLKV